MRKSTGKIATVGIEDASATYILYSSNNDFKMQVTLAFLAKVTETTTRQIAELAQVNEVTLFRHFG